MSTIEGGMVSTNNTDLYDLMKLKRSHGMARESTRFADYAALNPDIDKQFLFVTDGESPPALSVCVVADFRFPRPSGVPHHLSEDTFFADFESLMFCRPNGVPRHPAAILL